MGNFGGGGKLASAQQNVEMPRQCSCAGNIPSSQESPYKKGSRSPRSRPRVRVQAEVQARPKAEAVTVAVGGIMTINI